MVVPVVLPLSDFCLKDEGYDSWDLIANYIFQVILCSVLPLGDSTFVTEEL